MALTPFGKAVRKARLDAEVTLSDMAIALGVTSAFLSAMETGRKKIPSDLVAKAESFFAQRGTHVERLQPLADVSNASVSLEGLNPEHQLMVAGFARASWDHVDMGDLEKLKQLLKKIGGN
ncbi:helix-turn-helix transcriptional regulator [Paraburkholderia sp. JHI869]|uniref:helix-turn-helix domain-containing protein n=1 Tax=Paraburkholderia sp. JHI869 TaxID=3112959 RepID=UPI003180409E